MKEVIQKPIKVTINNRTIAIISIIILIFCVGALYLAYYQISPIGNETRIVKVKYLNMGGLTDNCGHPEMYHSHLDMTKHKINLSETYELTITSYRTGSRFISDIKRVEEEKYIEKC